MAIDYQTLKARIIAELTKAGFGSTQAVNDYWLAIAKALMDLEGEGSDDHLVKADSTDANYGALIDKMKGVDGVTLSTITEGGVKKLQVSGTANDHLVKASDADSTAPGSLQAKIKVTNGITLSLVTEGGVQKVQLTGPTIPAGVTLSSAIPEPDGIGSEGNLSSGKATAEGHVHPLREVAGGDLYLVDTVPAELITYYGTPVIGIELCPMLDTSPPAAWESYGRITTGSFGAGWNY